MKKITSLKNAQIRVFPSDRHHTIDTFMLLAEYVAGQLSELTPEFWSFYEPINKPFDIQDIKKAFIFSCINVSCSNKAIDFSLNDLAIN